MKFSNLETDNPKLRGRKLKNGQTISLFLEYYLGHEHLLDENTGESTRKKHSRSEWLSLYITDKPKKQQQNVQRIVKPSDWHRPYNWKELKKCRASSMEKSLIRYDNYFDYMQDYYDNYEKADKRHFKSNQDIQRLSG